MTHLEPGGRGILASENDVVSTWRKPSQHKESWSRNSPRGEIQPVLAPFPRPPPLPREHVMYQKASICVTHWYFSKQPWMFFLGHHKLLPTHDFLTHPSLFQAKLPTKKKKHKVTQIYGSWLKSRRRNAVWRKQRQRWRWGSGTGHTPRGGKGRWTPGFLSGRQAFPTARMSQVSANPPTAQSPRGGGQCFLGALSKPSLSLRLRPHR